MSIIGRDPVSGSVWLSDPYLSLGSSGPSRVATGKNDPEPKLPPLGFVSREEFEKATVEKEPLLWEGD